MSLCCLLGQKKGVFRPTPLKLDAGGSFGTVYKAIDKVTGEVVAIKHV